MYKVNVRKQMVLTDGSLAIGLIFFGIGILLDGGINWNSNTIFGDSILSSIMVLLGFLFVLFYIYFTFRKTKKDVFDELAEKNLLKAEANSFWCAIIFIVFIGIFSYSINISGGYIIIGSGILESLRIVLFIIYDKLGN